MTAEQLREHLAQAEQHIAELKGGSASNDSWSAGYRWKVSCAMRR